MTFDRYSSWNKAIGWISGLYSKNIDTHFLLFLLISTTFIYHVSYFLLKIWEGPQIMRKCDISSLEREQKTKLKVN